MINIKTPLTDDVIEKLKAGDNVTITGEIYTGRDAAHKRMIEAIEKGEELPVDLKNQIIYYVGPCPAKSGEIIGSCGPTTSGRVDKYTPTLLDLGLKGMLGKGERNEDVIEAIKRNKCVYLGAIGGAGALIAQCVKKQEVIAYGDLGTEAIHRLTVENLPATVIIDCEGNNLYKIGRSSYIK